MNWSEFFYMDGYAFYVWTSYGLAFIVMLANFLSPWLNGRKQRRELAGRLRRRSRA